MTPKELLNIYRDASHKTGGVASNLNSFAEYDLTYKDPIEYIEVYEFAGDLKGIKNTLAHKCKCLEMLFDTPHYINADELDYETTAVCANRLTDCARGIKKRVKSETFAKLEAREIAKELEKLAAYLESSAREIRRG